MMVGSFATTTISRLMATTRLWLLLLLAPCILTANQSFVSAQDSSGRCWWLSNDRVGGLLDQTINMNGGLYNIDRISEVAAHTSVDGYVDYIRFVYTGYDAVQSAIGVGTFPEDDKLRDHYTYGELQQVKLFHDYEDDRIAGIDLHFEGFIGHIGRSTSHETVLMQPGSIIRAFDYVSDNAPLKLDSLIPIYAKERDCYPCPMHYDPSADYGARIDANVSDLAYLATLSVNDWEGPLIGLKLDCHSKTFEGGYTNEPGDATSTRNIYSASSPDALECLTLGLSPESVVIFLRICRRDTSDVECYDIGDANQSNMTSIDSCENPAGVPDDWNLKVLFNILPHWVCPTTLPLIDPRDGFDQSLGATSPASAPSPPPTNAPGDPYTVEQLGGLSIAVEADTRPISFQDSACAIRYSARPWGVGCKFNSIINLSGEGKEVGEARFGFPSAPFSNPGFSLEMVTLLFDPSETAEGTFLAVDIGMNIPSPISLIPDIEIDTMRVVEVSQQDLERGVCNRNGFGEFCGEFCINAVVEFNEEGTGAEAKVIGELTLFDDFRSYGASSVCQAFIKGLGLTKPVVMELDLGEIIYGSVTKARDATKRRPSRRRGAETGGAIVSAEGKFLFGTMVVPPKPVALAPPDKAFALPSTFPSIDIADSFSISLADTGCGIAYSRQPWSVDCNATATISHNNPALNNGQPLDLQIFASGVVDTRKDSPYLLMVRYGLRMGSSSIQYSSTKDPLAFGPLEYSAGSFALTEADIEVGICLSNLPDWFPEVSEASLKADQISLSAATVGLDVCFQLEGSSGVSTGSDGAQLRFLMGVTLLREDVALPGQPVDLAIEEAQIALGLNGPMTFKLDMGELMLKSVSAITRTRGRHLQQPSDTSGLITSDYAFNLGSRVGEEKLIPGGAEILSFFTSIVLGTFSFLFIIL